MARGNFIVYVKVNRDEIQFLEQELTKGVKPTSIDIEGGEKTNWYHDRRWCV